ncbi:TBC1 domain family member 10B-like [Nyctibius grandis]|uniref:TBC1 domain family member 10B-like n=1 Tax=Nyctibius grandis TaxID=48427 RepID=UPI0035BC6F5D
MCRCEEEAEQVPTCTADFPSAAQHSGGRFPAACAEQACLPPTADAALRNSPAGWQHIWTCPVHGAAWLRPGQDLKLEERKRKKKRRRRKKEKEEKEKKKENKKKEKKKKEKKKKEKNKEKEKKKVYS